MSTSCQLAGLKVGSPALAFPSTKMDRNFVRAGQEEVNEGDNLQVWSISPPQRGSSNSDNLHPILLQVSDDTSLASTRHALLRMAGFDVYTCTSTDNSCLREALGHRLAVVVLCQSVGSETALFLCHFLSGNDRGIATVRISKRPWQEQESGTYSLVLQAPLAPVEFVSTMMQLRVQPPTSSTLE